MPEEINEEQAVEELEIYNDEQRFWANVAENAKLSIKQYNDGIKLAEATIEMAEGKVEDAR